MTIFVKSAVQNLDCEINRLTEIRNQLAQDGNPVIGRDVFPPKPEAVPVQALEPAAPAATRGKIRKIAARSGKHFRQAMKTANGGGRRVDNLRAENAALTPLCAEMLQAGRVAAEPFTTDHLTEQTGCSRKQASNAITRWIILGFIKRTGRGEYRRLAKFPGGKEAAVSVSRSPSPRPSPPGEGEAVPSPVAGPTPVPKAYQPTIPTGGMKSITDAAPTAEEKLTPYSAKGIAIGKSLKVVFNMDELAALLPTGKPGAYYFMSQWRNKNWIRKEDHDVYRKEKTFGD